jgi:hypothetical protein
VDRFFVRASAVVRESFVGVIRSWDSSFVGSFFRGSHSLGVIACSLGHFAGVIIWFRFRRAGFVRWLLELWASLPFFFHVGCLLVGIRSSVGRYCE